MKWGVEQRRPHPFFGLAVAAQGAHDRGKRRAVCVQYVYILKKNTKE